MARHAGTRTRTHGPVCARCGAASDDAARQCRKCRASLELGLLQVVSGDLPEAAYVLKPRPYSLGRAPETDITLPDASVSRFHARIVRERDGFWIEDDQSRNGVFLESAKVKRALLGSGSLIRLGNVVLKFLRLDEDASTADARKEGKPRARAGGRTDTGWAREALHQLQLGVVLVGGDGAVVFANRSAKRILEEGDGLALGPGRLVATDPGATAELRKLIGAGGAGARGGALAIPRASRRPLSLLVTPLGSEAGRIDAPSAVKAVFISDPERGVETSEESLRRLYGLTPAEARLALELLQGKTLEEAAGDLAISLHTARGHLKTVFLKTDTRRQSELVRLLLSGPGQVRKE